MLDGHLLKGRERVQLIRCRLKVGDLPHADNYNMLVIYWRRCANSHGVDSARSASTLAELRAKLARHVTSPVVRDFLDSTS